MKSNLSFPVFAMSLLAATTAVRSQSAAVDFAAPQQVIDGFGASSAWHGVLNSKELDAAFLNGNSNQLGLSILRVDIDPGGESRWSAQRTNATEAKKRGAKYVLGTPWSPPASMKSNNNTTGGELKTDQYAAYANYLKSFRTYMGTALDVVSIQNEPNIKVDYVSCDWTAAQLYNFAKNHAQAIGGDVMMPETFNYDLSYSDQVLNDATAAANISHIGLHLYGSQMKTYANAVNKGKRIWMTEKYFDPDDIGTALTMGKEIMDCLNNKMNAYIWWYIRMPNCNYITSTGSVLLKGHVMGQFSKYVRPGYKKVNATFSPQTGVTVVAFTGERNVIVAMNQTTSSKSQAFVVSGAGVEGFSRTTTSGSKRIVAEASVKAVNGGFSLTLEPQSITTLVSEGTSAISNTSGRREMFLREGNVLRATGSRLDLRDQSGRLVQRVYGSDGRTEIDLTGLQSGVYVADCGGRKESVLIANH